MHQIFSFSAKPAPKLRQPDAEDGAEIWQLVRDCKPLDENSMYCNLIQCDHFAETCVVATLGDHVVGWISAYILPSDPETLFVWQVAVSDKVRGQGLGPKMIAHVLDRDVCEDVRQIQTTITDDNDASWAMFRKFARRNGAVLSAQPHYKSDDHFNGEHETENLISIKLRGERRNAA